MNELLEELLEDFLEEFKEKFLKKKIWKSMERNNSWKTFFGECPKKFMKSSWKIFGRNLEGFFEGLCEEFLIEIVKEFIEEFLQKIMNVFICPLYLRILAITISSQIH